MSIPRIIHQTHWDPRTKPLPETWIKAQNTWIHHHPHWKHMVWLDKDNEQFLREHYPWFLPIFLEYPYDIQRADAIRPFLLYHWGGLYVDMDFVCTRPFDATFRHPGVYIAQSTTWVCTNALMASSPRHPFWLRVIHEMMLHHQKKIYQTRHLYIMQSTGSVLISRCFKIYTRDKLHQDVFLLPREVYNAKDFCSQRPESGRHLEGVYSYSLNSGSWHSTENKVMNYVYCKRYTLLIILVVIVCGLCLCMCMGIYKNKKKNMTFS